MLWLKRCVYGITVTALRQLNGVLVLSSSNRWERSERAVDPWLNSTSNADNRTKILNISHSFVGYFFALRLELHFNSLDRVCWFFVNEAFALCFHLFWEWHIVRQHCHTSDHPGALWTFNLNNCRLRTRGTLISNTRRLPGMWGTFGVWKGRSDGYEHFPGLDWCLPWETSQFMTGVSGPTSRG